MGSPIPGQNYTVQSGDNLQRISIRAYGIASKWTKIAAANNISNPDLIFPGQVIYIPPDEEKKQEEIRLTDAKTKTSRYTNKNKEQVTLVLDGRELPHTQGRFAYGIDVLASSYNCTIAWTPDKDKWLDNATARGSFAPSELYIGNKLVCTGRLYGRENIIRPDGMSKNLEFFSLTADIVDSHIPPAFSEIRNSNLRQIAELLLSGHGFPVTFKDDPGTAFDIIERNGIETVAHYIQRLASQRGLFVSCDEHGGVVFQKAANSGKPIAKIEFEDRLAYEYRARFDDRQRFARYFASSIAGDGTPLNATATDPAVPTARQILFEANDSDAGNIQEAAEWRMIRIELEALSVNFPVTEWFDRNGEIWKPNTIITAKSPVLDIPDEFNFIVRQAEFVWSAVKRGAVLNLVPPLSVQGGQLRVGME